MIQDLSTRLQSSISRNVGAHWCGVEGFPNCGAYEAIGAYNSCFIGMCVHRVNVGLVRCRLQMTVVSWGRREIADNQITIRGWLREPPHALMTSTRKRRRHRISIEMEADGVANALHDSAPSEVGDAFQTAVMWIPD